LAHLPLMHPSIININLGGILCCAMHVCPSHT
jgi:hypothetical protein